jgi:hypothetical protein
MMRCALRKIATLALDVRNDEIRRTNAFVLAHTIFYMLLYC